ncbi:MAG: homospermidine synthase [Betaproteobacteria bacterium]|nr:homospermidine synthase [Betaproteobacteria bacterium]
MVQEKKHIKFPGKLVMVGCGSVGQGVLPLILRHIDMDASRISIVTADDRGREEARRYGIKFSITPLTPDNYERVLGPLLGAGDFLLNVSVDVSSAALIDLCCRKGANYLDTCIEPWAGGYTDSSLTPSQRSNYALRENARALNRKYPQAPTCILTHGANPGWVSHFVKQALLNLANDAGVGTETPGSREQWAQLAQRLGVKAIHIAERDTQIPTVPKRPGEFMNTWSIDGFVGEGQQPAELGWGAHERHFPHDGHRHDFGCGAAIYLLRPGASTRVRTWTPLAGPIHGFLITHGESISIADYLTVRNGDQAIYRPTCHYAYHPCDGAVLSVHELGGRNWRLQEKTRLILDEVVSGIDELGVLLMGHAKGAYWYGSRLSIEEARKLAPYNNATSLQVSAGVLSAVIWAMENPRRGVIDPDEMDFRRAIEIATPYLGEVVGVYGDWTPLHDRGWLFEEDLDASDPWQFKNFRVV